MGRIFQDLNHRVKSCGAAVCISLNSGAWWEGLQGCFFVIPHACKESSNPLLPLSHACVKARSPCLFSSGTLARMILSSFFFPSLMGLTGASGADFQLYHPAAFLFLSYQEELFLKSLNFFFSPAPTCSLLVPRLLFPSPWCGAAGPWSKYGSLEGGCPRVHPRHHACLSPCMPPLTFFLSLAFQIPLPCSYGPGPSAEQRFSVTQSFTGCSLPAWILTLGTISVLYLLFFLHPFSPTHTNHDGGGKRYFRNH